MPTATATEIGTWIVAAVAILGGVHLLLGIVKYSVELFVAPSTYTERNDFKALETYTHSFQHATNNSLNELTLKLERMRREMGEQITLAVERVSDKLEKKLDDNTAATNRIEAMVLKANGKDHRS